MGAVIVMFIVGVGAVMGAYYAFTMLPGLMQQRRLENRLVEVTSLAQADDKAGAAGLVKERKEGLLPMLDRLASATARGSALSSWLEQTGTKVSVSSLVILAIASALIVGFLATVITRMSLAMIVGGIIGAAIPPLILNIKRTRRMRRFEETFPEALDLMARALKAGHAFATGLKMVADEMDEPVGPEFRKTFDEQNFGLPMKDSLQNLTERMPIIDVRFFATAVLIQRETGGNLAEILENLAHVVRERFKILRQVRVYTAHGRLTGWVLLALPAFLAIALAFINPSHMQVLFREHMGQMMLIGAGVMQTVGYFWIKQVIKIEV
jgi:tight adherence protein B